MRKLIAMCALVTPFLAASAWAQPGATPANPSTPANAATPATPATPPTHAAENGKPAPSATTKAANPQQDKMKACNEQAAGKKGDDRKAFMKQCLSAAGVPKSQQDKMAACSKEGKGKKGDDYKAFMKDCLSKPA